METQAYPKWQLALDSAAIALFALFGALLIYSGITSFAVTSQNSEFLAAKILLMVLAAWLSADFVSGLVHFLADNFGNPDTPFFGKVFIYAFREHHVDPKAITRHSFIETNGANCLVSLPPMIYIWVATSPTHDYLLRLYFVLFFLSIFLTNQIHKWSHMDSPPRLVGALQSAHVILPVAHHAVHHAAPHDKYYCITCGWLNAPLERLHFFQAIRKLLK
ncbi:fatty acid desaturase CarF family protein [Turneriella parva]|uniref:Kua-ubiquitin conjugating protein n=1 Tax=Turneriella parva (strain ATCC BAA-1111 / DSM 21527 / NCTC 11395 / H) TaxID=869212 RepID=I4B354_TURPD|nr:fatty acid desaturase CarF family protein [Turneriella parva]AFM11711.1 Kua-ubiquitin conjugating protein [Turneriella parva DSM 21527]